LEEFRVQAAVPKQMKLRLETASSSQLTRGQPPVTQKMSITHIGNPSESPKNVVMKIRMMYRLEGKEEKDVILGEIRFPQ